MVETRIADCSSVDRNRPSPNQKPENVGDKLELSEEEKQWEEAICPICMEHPHNAVLLICSSHPLGCRPYICNTISMLSNCFDQFCRSSGYHPFILPSIKNLTSISYSWIEAASGGINHLQSKSKCPFCRGIVYGYVIMKSARQYMDSRPRECPNAMCDFTGSYSELRNHARSKHASSVGEHEDLLNFLLEFV